MCRSALVTVDSCSGTTAVRWRGSEVLTPPGTVYVGVGSSSPPPQAAARRAIRRRAANVRRFTESFARGVMRQCYRSTPRRARRQARSPRWSAFPAAVISGAVRRVAAVSGTGVALSNWPLTAFGMSVEDGPPTVIAELGSFAGSYVDRRLAGVAASVGTLTPAPPVAGGMSLPAPPTPADPPAPPGVLPLVSVAVGMSRLVPSRGVCVDARPRHRPILALHKAMEASGAPALYCSVESPCWMRTAVVPSSDESLLPPPLTPMTTTTASATASPALVMRRPFTSGCMRLAGGAWRTGRASRAISGVSANERGAAASGIERRAERVSRNSSSCAAHAAHDATCASRR